MNEGFPTCDHCQPHPWHGLPCNKCGCPSAFQLTPAEAAWVDRGETCTGDHT